MPPVDYWTTVSALMPALAAAVVVEGRRLIRYWPHLPSYIKAVQVIMWAAILVPMALAEPACLRTIRGVPPPTHLVTVAELTINGAITVLFISPVITYVAYGAVMGWASLKGLLLLRGISRIRKNLRVMEEGDREVDDTLREGKEILETLRSQVSEIDEKLERHIDEDERRRLIALRTDIKTRIVKGGELLEDLESRRNEVRAEQATLFEDLSSFETKAKRNVTDFVQQTRTTLIRGLGIEELEQPEERRDATTQPEDAPTQRLDGA